MSNLKQTGTSEDGRYQFWEGHGLYFDTPDVTGESFGADTDFALGFAPVKNVFIDHTLGEDLVVQGKKYRLAGVDEPVGIVQEVTPDDTGLYVKLMLDTQAKYWKIVDRMLATKNCGLSSGAVGHWCRKAGLKYVRWPIVEWSLTLWPAEPRTVTGTRLKSLGLDLTDLEEVQAETSDATEVDLDNQEVEIVTKSSRIANAAVEIQTESTTMPPEVTTVQVDTGPLESIMGELATGIKGLSGVVTSMNERLTAMEAVKDIKVDVVQDETDKAADGWDSFGEQLVAIKNAAIQPHSIDTRLLAGQKRAGVKALGMSEGVNADGGYLVQSTFSAELIRRTYETGILSSKVRRFPINANSNGLVMNVLDDYSRVAGSRWGGITSYWMSEAGTKIASKPKFKQMEWRLNKLIGMCYATDELLQDATALSSVITEGFSEEFGFQLDSAILSGPGGGIPLGIYNGNSVISIAKEAGQTAATIVYSNVVKMWARLWARSRQSAVWYINQDAEPQLYSMIIPGTTIPAYMPPGGLSGQQYGTLFGRPVMPIEQASTLGTVGDIALLDLNQYGTIDKGGMQSASSIHVQFVTDETVFRFVYRTDGMPLWTNVLTPANGSNTQSPFITLATRS